jgi:SAM-dependent methyltransferase
MDTWQWCLLVLLALLLINYVVRMGYDRLLQPTAHEGFTSQHKGGSNWLTGELIYDDFYAAACNKIFQHDALVQGEGALLLQEWSRGHKDNHHIRVLDALSGTGVATCHFAKHGVAKAVGLDKAPSMIRFSKNVVMPATTLTEPQKEVIEWREADVYSPFIASQGEFTHACLLFFSVYEVKDLSALFKNLALWIQPGGGLAIEVVNKHKFEPVPDVANPWVAVSPQTHAKTRITKSKAVFDTFDYSTDFELEEDRAEFKEIFKFKDGTKRRQKHVLYMPDISVIIKKATDMGFTYTKYVDLRFMGFNYGYMLFFTRV